MKLELIVAAALSATVSCALATTALGSDTTHSLIGRAFGESLKPEEGDIEPEGQPVRPPPSEEDPHRLGWLKLQALIDADPPAKYKNLITPPDISVPVSNKISEIRINAKDREYVLFWGTDLQPVAKTVPIVLNLGHKYDPDKARWTFPKPIPTRKQALVANFKATSKDWYRRVSEVLKGDEAAPLKPKPVQLTEWQASRKTALEKEIYLLADRDGFLIRYVDNTGAGTASPDKRDLLSRDVGTQLYERSVVAGISVAEQNSSVDHQDSHSDTAAQFQLNINAFNTIQSNISDLLWPVFDTILNGTTESIFVEIAWSIYSDLTGSTTHLSGPFANGMNCIDTIESQLFNSTNNATTTNDDYLATAEILLEFYNDAWAKASAAANQTGLLDYLAEIASQLAPNDTSVVPVGFMTQPVASPDDSYFMQYNKTLSSRRKS